MYITACYSRTCTVAVMHHYLLPFASLHVREWLYDVCYIVIMAYSIVLSMMLMLGATSVHLSTHLHVAMCLQSSEKDTVSDHPLMGYLHWISTEVRFLDRQLSGLGCAL